jgi:hypothetical protein
MAGRRDVGFRYRVLGGVSFLGILGERPATPALATKLTMPCAGHMSAARRAFHATSAHYNVRDRRAAPGIGGARLGSTGGSGILGRPTVPSVPPLRRANPAGRPEPISR